MQSWTERHNFKLLNKSPLQFNLTRQYVLIQESWVPADKSKKMKAVLDSLTRVQSGSEKLRGHLTRVQRVNR